MSEKRRTPFGHQQQQPNWLHYIPNIVLSIHTKAQCEHANSSTRAPGIHYISTCQLVGTIPFGTVILSK